MAHYRRLFSEVRDDAFLKQQWENLVLPYYTKMTDGTGGWCKESPCWKPTSKKLKINYNGYTYHTTSRKLAAFIAFGRNRMDDMETFKPDSKLFCTCGHDDCINPGHLVMESFYPDIPERRLWPRVKCFQFFEEGRMGECPHLPRCGHRTREYPAIKAWLVQMYVAAAKTASPEMEEEAILEALKKMNIAWEDLAEQWNDKLKAMNLI